MAYYAYMEAIHTWQLRTIVDNHNCSREHKLRILNAKWLSKMLEKTVRENPKVKGEEIREKINRKWNVGVSRCMAYRAKAIASDHVDGSFKDQYTRIYDYANELLARNPGSTVKVKVEENEDGHIFRRFYTFLKAYKDSFVSCRPIIGLDGAFLKGKYGGEMLNVVGRDANDQMLPLAYAMVEVENKDTWRWFLELLVEDLGGEEGLLQVVQEVVPGVDKRFYVRHLYANLRKKSPRKQLKRTGHDQDLPANLNVILWKWAITGIPCCYSLAAMKFLNLDAENFIPCCFRKSTYEEIYSLIVYPINGNKMWEITTYVDVLPPPKIILPGRPKKKRRLEQ
ncbi:uncharacterized protein LOC124821985 [Vigna umbellata]|uniref:uncharacterized protein LOC124821985 n=1 Tax=Vigna umbellata TaxID=87088 RepID=UPI001F5F2534|nr:uncharacterized protein LOC124821985 [Vigna umbellata]